MITELKRLCEELDVETQIVITPSEDHGSEQNATKSNERETEAFPKYVETKLDDDVIEQFSGWIGDSALQDIDENHVLAELDEILLLLIAVRGEAIGTELGDDLNRVFGTTLSPGTIYPRLADLTDQGLLTVTELPRRKVYEIADEEAVYDRLEAEIDRLLAFSVTLRSLLLECAGDDQKIGDTQ